MSGSLRIIPLGGLGEVGKNMTVVESEGGIVVIDAGLSFPRDEHLGVDLILPDFGPLEDRRDDIRAVILTHGHEDHVGALPYFLREIGADAVQLFDTWAGLLSAEQFEEWAVPPAREALAGLTVPTIYVAPGAAHDPLAVLGAAPPLPATTHGDPAVGHHTKCVGGEHAVEPGQMRTRRRDQRTDDRRDRLDPAPGGGPDRGDPGGGVPLYLREGPRPDRAGPDRPGHVQGPAGGARPPPAPHGGAPGRAGRAAHAESVRDPHRVAQCLRHRPQPGPRRRGRDPGAHGEPDVGRRRDR